MSVAWWLVLAVVAPVAGVVTYSLSVVLPPFVRWRWWKSVSRWRLARMERLAADAMKRIGRGDWSGLDRLQAEEERMREAMRRRQAAHEEWGALARRYGGER